MATPQDPGKLDVWLYRLPDTDGKSGMVRAELSKLDSDVMVVRCTLEVARSIKRLAVTNTKGEHVLHVLLRRSAGGPGARLLPTRIGSAKRVRSTDEVLLTLNFIELEPQECEFLADLIERFHPLLSARGEPQTSSAPEQDGADLDL